MKAKRSVKEGDVVGRLKVLEIIRPTFYATARVRCECGTVKTVQLQQLFRGTQSCGCLKKEVMRARGKQLAEGGRAAVAVKKAQKAVNKRESKALKKLPPAWKPWEDITD